ncbi:alpha/beta hydrolase [Kitasatospora sp. NBC_01539]|uniref:alpha/beta hydrolase n=1 Tax=Kitasatospora sp. NBC_01539 TaxID=2903577 RepID=UPI003860229A
MGNSTVASDGVRDGSAGGEAETEDFVFEGGGQRLAATRTVRADGSRPGVLALHGLGTTATRHRIRYLLDAVAAHGHGWLTFDFGGNGESTGALTTSTLRGRRAETLAAAAHLDPATAPVLIGTSMGAHLAAASVPRLRPRGLVLFCPAAYPADAEGLPFDGSLARPGNYPDSPAYAGLRDFDGDLLVVTAGQDQVVGPEVVDGYLESARNARSAEVVRLDDCDHFVHRWLPGQPERRDEVVQAMLRLLSAEAPTLQRS